MPGSFETAWLMSAAASLVVGLAMLTLWQVDRTDRAAAAWAVQWIANALRQVCRHMATGSADPLAFLGDAAAVLTIAMALAGTLLMLGRRVPVRSMLAAGFALIAMLAASRLAGRPLAWPVLPTVGLAVIATSSVLLLRTAQAPRTGYRLLGIAQLLLAIAAVTSYLLREDVRFGLAASLAVFVLTLGFGAALLTVTLLRRQAAVQRLTEQLAAENAARLREQQRFQDIVETTFDFVWERDRELRYTYISPRKELITGLPPEAYLGKTSEETRPGEPRSRGWRELNRLLQAHVPFQDVAVEVMHPRDQRRQILSISGKPVFDPATGFAGYRGTGRDVTKEHETRAILAHIVGPIGERTGDDYLRELVKGLALTLEVDVAIVGVLAEDRDRILTRAAFADGAPMADFDHALAGTPSAEVIGGDCRLYADGVQALFPEDRGLKLLGAVGLAGVPLCAATGEPLGLVVLVKRSPITNRELIDSILRLVAPRAAAELDRQRAEARLRHTETLFRAVVDNIPVGIAVRDLDSRLVAMNRTLAEWSGASAEQAIGTTFGQFAEKHNLAAERRTALQRHYDTVLATGQPVTEEIPASALSGRRDIAVTYFPIFGETRSISHIGAVLVDVSEPKRMERSLRESQKMQALGQLAGGIAHDFNNILGAIAGYASFIAEDAPAASSQRDHAEKVLAAANRAKQIVQQILAFARRSDSTRQPLEVGGLVDETVALLRPLLPASTRLTVGGAGDAGIRGDSAQIVQVLLNICLNANDALGERGGGIDIVYERRGAEAWAGLGDGLAVLPDGGARFVAMPAQAQGDWAAIRIGDTGCGMAAAVLGRMFEPFFTTKAKGSGTGLGLSVVHGIVAAHGGGMIVTSGPGQGTSFEILLPLRTGAPVAAAKPAPAAAAVASPRKGRVLLVDDDMHFGDMLQTALERAGYEVAICQDPREAEQAFRADPTLWDALVTDQTMPGMKGTDLLRIVKLLRPSLPCLLCSGYSSRLDEAGARRAGADAYLLKPLPPAALAATLERAIANARVGAG